MLRLNCSFQAHEGRYDEALQAAIALTAASLQEEGCVAYDVYESGTRPDALLICETWTDETALAKHMDTPHFATYVAVLEACGDLKLEKFQFTEN